jgi:tRNA (guanosine-2'-O-)-methyltransferase
MEDNSNIEKYISYLESFVTENRKKIFKEILEKRTRYFTVVLEDLYQMHNVSAVVRSCDVFGLQDVHIIQKKYDPKLSHAIAKGAEKWLSIYRHNDTLQTINELKNKGYQIVATTPHTNEVLLPEFDINTPSAFFFGVEKDGLSDVVMQEADIFLKIPMHGFTESLNISVAAALTMYETTEKLRKSTIPWQLTPEEKRDIYLSWLEKSIKSIDLIKKDYFDKNRKI